MKNLLKSGFKLLAWLIMLPLIALYHFLALLVHKDEVFSSFCQLISLLPGNAGSYLRIGFLRSTMKQCEADLFIGFGTLFSQQGTELRSGVYIGPQCNIGLCRIGKNTLVGSGVHLLSGKNQHRFDDPDLPIKDQGGRFESITIGEDCWLGNGAIVMANIGDRCIIGAGAVVTQDIFDGSVVAGNPAKVIKQVPLQTTEHQ